MTTENRDTLLMSATALLLISFLLAAPILKGYSDLELSQDADQTYCEMVGIHTDTDGDLGWPAYDTSINCE